MEAAIRAAAGAERCELVPATELASALLGDAIFTNPFLLGFAAQKGLLPVGLPALERAIELNGRAVAENRRALAWGRLAAVDRAAVERAAVRGLRPEPSPAGDGGDLAGLVARRGELLTAYQGAALASRYAALVQRVAARERALGDGRSDLARAVARAYAKLLAVKDEYEVARLYTDGSFQRQLEAEFEGPYRVELHLAPQFLPRWLPDRITGRDPGTGLVKKRAFGPWFFAVLRVLARLRFLRGTPLDPFGRTAHRRLERHLAREYEALLEELLAGLTPESRDLAVELASLPEQVRGFDHVKERQLEAARGKQAELLAAFRLRAGAS
jgi:indolepyruvate ferredoxin oxidoreductase